MKRKNLILLVLLLAIGFATVSTTLILNGTLNIGENNEDFDVYFSASLEDGIENNKLIKDDTHLEFSKDMSLVGEKYILEYDVTNGSRNYDAEVTINCTESNEYLSVTNEFDTTTNLLATETRRGKLTIEVLKPYVGTTEEPTKDINITCEIVGNAKEREKLGEGTPNPKVENCSIDNPTIYENGVWKYTDNDCSGDLTKNDLITLDTESFYVYNVEGDNVKAISQYNVDVTSTGLQAENAEPAPFTTDEKYEASEEVDGVTLNKNDYSISTIKDQVDAYKEKLEELNGNISEARLITRGKLYKAGCGIDSCESSPSYIYSTSYWTMTPHVDNTSIVWCIHTDGNFYVVKSQNNSWNDVTVGVRPIIEVSKSLIEGKEEVKETSWKLTKDNDENGAVSKGDLITLGTESFYVYDIEGENVKAIACYNLYVGDSNYYDETLSEQVFTPLVNPTGLQNARAIGTIEDEDVAVGVVPFTTNKKYNELKNSGGQLLKKNDYSISVIKDYVDAYKIKLDNLKGNTSQVRLITKEELEALGCDSSNRTCISAPSYIYTTSYWTASPDDESDYIVYYVMSDGYFDGDAVGDGYREGYSNEDGYYGTRPVVELNASLIS